MEHNKKEKLHRIPMLQYPCRGFINLFIMSIINLNLLNVSEIFREDYVIYGYNL